MTKPFTNVELEVRLWDEIKKSRFGMLGLTGGAPDHHFNPMTAFTESHDASLWFFTRDDTDLAKAAAAGDHNGVFVFQSKDQTMQACLTGKVTLTRDAARVDAYWSSVTAAWFPEGKKDPHLAMLCLEVANAQVWLSETGSLKFAWEILKANVTSSQPDIGEHASLDMRR